MTFASRKEARREARAVLPGEQLQAYRCDTQNGNAIGGWHLGHLAPEVRSGELGRDIYEIESEA